MNVKIAACAAAAVLPVGFLVKPSGTESAAQHQPPGVSSFFSGLIDKLTNRNDASEGESSQTLIPIKLRDEAEEAQFARYTNQPGKLVVVIFNADWCASSRRLKPVMDTVAAEFPDVAIGRIDIDRAQALSYSHHVGRIPDVRFYRDGEEVGSFVGYAPVDKVRARVQSALSHAEPTHPLVSAVTPNKALAVAAHKQEGGSLERMSRDWRPAGLEKQKR